jgi:methionyl-tRNA formyltransferase
MNSRKIIVFLGAGKVAEECIVWLLEQKYPVIKIILVDLNPKILRLTREWNIGTKLFDPNTSNFVEKDVFVLSLWFPRIISEDDLSRAYETVNIHPGLVPAFRGNDSATWSILLSEKCGVSLLQMNRQVDAGKVWAQEVVEIPKAITGGELLEILKTESVSLFKSHFDEIYQGKINASNQVGEIRTFTRKETNQNRVRKVEEFESVSDFVNWALAHNHSPKFLPEIFFEGRKFKVELTGFPYDEL